MSSIASDLLFYNAQADSPSGWKDTASAVRNAEDPDATNELLRQMVTFASDFGLSGNIWQYWLTYMLMMHENAFSLTCERQHLQRGATIFELAKNDFSFIKDLFHSDPIKLGALSVMTAYTAPYIGNEPNRAGKIITSLSADLAAAGSADSFGMRIAEHYATFGVGIFGLYKAFRISETERDVSLTPVTDDTDVCFDDLIGLETQKQTLRENTEAFLNGKHANNVLLYGDSGTGKSTSIHALMHDYFDKGLRLVELTKTDRRLLPQVMASIKKRNYHFIIYLDDLSFEENESDYKELKAMLEGALEKRSDRILIYATSNRRHLIRETWTDRNDMEYQNDIHHSDTMEEKLSLASRFGVTIYYSKPVPEEYLHIVKKLAERNDITLSEKELYDRARKWELRHGGMSGRTASQLITWLQSEAG
ncbi:MAG: ATP-binding protein [Flexilinea sp.]|nr:ATP-binding protein [Flexilinea sp.]